MTDEKDYKELLDDASKQLNKEKIDMDGIVEAIDCLLKATEEMPRICKNCWAYVGSLACYCEVFANRGDAEMCQHYWPRGLEDVTRQHLDRMMERD